MAALMLIGHLVLILPLLQKSGKIGGSTARIGRTNFQKDMNEICIAWEKMLK